MTKQLILSFVLIAAPPLIASSALATTPPELLAGAAPAPHPVSWAAAVAGPKPSDLQQALDRPLEYPWHMFDRKTGQRREAGTCRELLVLDETSEPMDVGDDGSPPTSLISNDWDIYVRYLVSCRVTVAIQAAKPARVGYLGTFPLDNSRLKEIPAAVVPTPSSDEAERLKKASARGVSWKGWDRRIHVTKTTGTSARVESPDTNCMLSVYGRGDLNGDGIEDLVLWRDGGGQEGTWRSTAAFVLTRRSPSGRIELLKVIE
jgi:hypothetical protein